MNDNSKVSMQGYDFESSSNKCRKLNAYWKFKHLTYDQFASCALGKSSFIINFHSLRLRKINQFYQFYLLSFLKSVFRIENAFRHEKCYLIYLSESYLVRLFFQMGLAALIKTSKLLS